MRLTERSKVFLTIPLIVALAALMFGRFLDNFFVYDDFAMMEHVIEGPMAVLTGYNFILRVVASCLLWPLFAFSGHDPFGYNLFCVLMYMVNGVLFYLFIRRLFKDSWLAFLAAVIFTSSSVGCDAVFWKAAYSTLINFTFYLLALILYTRYRQEDDRKCYWLSLVVFLLAVLSKEESASLPFVIVAMELLVFKGRIDRKLVKRVVPFCLLIAAYLVTNYVLIYHVFQGQSELVKHSGFRPLHTLFAPWSVFFIAPEGVLAMGDPRIYLTALLIPLALLFAGERRFFLFAVAWVFLTFLPQSLSTLSQFEPKYIFNSISRHLYIPSAGAALAYALLVMRVRAFLPARIFAGVCVVLLAGYFAFNYGRVQQRGEEWREEGIPARTFLTELKRIMPAFPPDSYVFVLNAPTGRAYVQQSLRAFYNNPAITWIVDPNTFAPRPGMSAYLMDCEWGSPYDVRIFINKTY